MPTPKHAELLAEHLRGLIKRRKTMTARLSTHIGFLDSVSLFFDSSAEDLLEIVEAYVASNSNPPDSAPPPVHGDR